MVVNGRDKMLWETFNDMLEVSNEVHTIHEYLLFYVIDSRVDLLNFLDTVAD